MIRWFQFLLVYFLRQDISKTYKIKVKSENSCKMSVVDNDNSVRPSECSSLLSKVESEHSFKKSVRLAIQEKGQDSHQDACVACRVLTPKTEPDTRLENWKRWLEIHKKQQDKLSNILKRPPQCLLMNMNFNDLYVNQEKRLITEASNYEFFDKYRGHPSFWRTDNGAECEGKKLGIYQPIQKRYDRSHPSTSVSWGPARTEIEFVGVPDVVMKEKGLTGDPCLPPPKDNWLISHYVAKKKQNLKAKLDQFLEHIPQSEELAVFGVSCTEESQKENICEHESSIFEENHENNISEITPNLENAETSIGDTINVAIDDDLLDNGLKVWTICFSDCLTNECYEKILHIENLGECCLRYSWEAVLPSWVKSPLPLRQNRNSQKVFHFNRNDNVVLPKSSGKVIFYLESEISGVFCEQWELHFSNAPDKVEYIMVDLQAVVDARAETEENLKIPDMYIESCMRYTVASKTVKEILDRSRPERPTALSYDWMFFEEQIFLFNNTNLFYESDYVYLLKEMYKQINEGPWDLSVQTLRKKLLEKALNEDMTETMNAFTAIVCHLMKPKLRFTFVNEKHKTVYELLCCFIEKMDKESNNLKRIFKIPFKISSSLNVVGDNILIKTLDRPTLKLNVKESIASKKSNRKKSIAKSSSSENKSSSSEQKENSLLGTGDSSGEISCELEEKIKKQEYLEALYIKSYHHLCKTVDNISAVIDSFDIQKKKSALNCLKAKYMTV